MIILVGTFPSIDMFSLVASVNLQLLGHPNLVAETIYVSCPAHYQLGSECAHPQAFSDHFQSPGSIQVFCEADTKMGSGVQEICGRNAYEG